MEKLADATGGPVEPPSFVTLMQRLGLARDGLRVGRFLGFDEQDRFLVRVDCSPEPVPALSTVRLRTQDVGAEVAVALEGGDPARPVIVGCLLRRAEAEAPLTAKVDGETVVLQANRRLELRCGEASVVLTAAGKVIIRGTYVLSRSRGANRIKGAFVDIN